MHIITAIVRMLHKLEAALDLPENTLVKKLTARIHNLCSYSDQFVKMVSLPIGIQSITFLYLFRAVHREGEPADWLPEFVQLQI